MSDDAEEPDFLSIRCDTCQARLRVRAKLAGTVARCPKCQAKIAIPRPFELSVESEQEENHPLHGADDVYQLSEVIDYQPDDSPETLPAELHRPAPEAGYLDALGQVRQEKFDRRPQYLYFTGVFDF